MISKCISVIFIALSTSNLYLLTPEGQGQGHGVSAQITGQDPDQLTVVDPEPGTDSNEVTEAPYPSEFTFDLDLYILTMTLK